VHLSFQQREQSEERGAICVVEQGDGPQHSDHSPFVVVETLSAGQEFS
jgi:hypothetical protein